MRKFTINLDEMRLISRHLGFFDNRVDWAFPYANGTVDTFVRVDHQKIGTFEKTVHGANADTVSVFAGDTTFCNNKGHRFYLK